MIVLIYISILTAVSSFFYLSLTISHIYLYFFIIIIAGSILKKYLYITYVVYLNFYWVCCILLMFYSLTCVSVTNMFNMYTTVLLFL